VLARNGAVTLDSNVITVASCATTTTTTTTTSATTATTATPLIKVTKTALPDGLPVGAGSVTYNYAVTNTGTLPLNDIKVTDDKCATVSHISGDTNRNGLIETAETWLYHCVTTLLNTTTNIVTASGTANGQTATATATATVVVGHPTLPNTGTPPVDRPWLWPSAAGVVILGYLAFKYRRIF
jgi:type VI secretion system secreted protein VgrG